MWALMRPKVGSRRDWSELGTGSQLGNARGADRPRLTERSVHRLLSELPAVRPTRRTKSPRANRRASCCQRFADDARRQLRVYRARRATRERRAPLSNVFLSFLSDFTSLCTARRFNARLSTRNFKQVRTVRLKAHCARFRFIFRVGFNSRADSNASNISIVLRHYCIHYTDFASVHVAPFVALFQLFVAWTINPC